MNGVNVRRVSDAACSIGRVGQSENRPPSADTADPSAKLAPFGSDVLSLAMDFFMGVIHRAGAGFNCITQDPWARRVKGSVFATQQREAGSFRKAVVRRGPIGYLTRASMARLKCS